mgnify:CR=1 FL=1
MKYLNRKLFRDILRNWTQFFSVFLMAFLSVLIFVGLQGAWHGLEVSLEEYINTYNLPDAWVQSIVFSENEIEQFENISGVDTVSSKIRVTTYMQTDESEDKYIILDTFNNTEMDFKLLEGRAPNISEEGVWINKEYANANSISVNDYINIEYGNVECSLKVLGIVQSADRIYFTGTLEYIAPNYSNYGYGYISENTLKNCMKYQGGANVLEIYGNNKELRNMAEDILGSKFVAYYDRNTLVDVSESLDRVGQIKNLSYMFSCIFILLAILAMYTTIRRLIETQTKEIAVLKALGFSNIKIGIHYAGFGAIVGLSGTGLGMAISPVLSSFVLWTQKSMFSIAEWKISYSLSSLLVVLLVIIICIVSALLAAKDAIGGLPALFLRGTVEKKGRKFILERIGNIWERFKFEHRWAIRDAAANKVRLFMGIVGVAGGMMLLIVGFGTPDSINHLVEKAYTEDFSYDKRLDVASYEDAKDKYSGQWVQISQARFSPDDGYNRLLIVISEGNYVNMRTVEGELIKDDGVYITQGFAERAHLTVGDEIVISPALYDTDFKFTIAGIITSETNQGAYIMQNVWEEAGGKFAPRTILVDESISNDIIEDDKNIVSVIEIEKQKENAYDFVDSLMSVFLMIIGFAILLVVVVLYNLGSLNFVERQRDYATLRVLGFHKNELRNITMIENVGTTLIGWILGVPLGIWFLDLYVCTFSTIRLEYTSYVSITTLFFASIVVWLASMTTTLFVSYRIKKLDMVEALKGVE